MLAQILNLLTCNQKTNHLHRRSQRSQHHTLRMDTLDRTTASTGPQRLIGESRHLAYHVSALTALQRVRQLAMTLAILMWSLTLDCQVVPQVPSHLMSDTRACFILRCQCPTPREHRHLSRAAMTCLSCSLQPVFSSSTSIVRGRRLGTRISRTSLARSVVISRWYQKRHR